MWYCYLIICFNWILYLLLFSYYYYYVLLIYYFLLLLIIIITGKVSTLKFSESKDVFCVISDMQMEIYLLVVVEILNIIGVFINSI